jgi:hypothetical protein
MSENSDNRVSQRRRTLIGAKIVLNGGASVMDCIVKDLSDGGARLALDGAIAVPLEFRLVLSDGRVFDCVVRWRRVNMLGVSFGQRDG